MMKTHLIHTLAAGLLLALAACADDSRESLDLPDELCITSFRVADCEAVIDEQHSTITLTLPSGTDLTALKPVVACTEGATLTPASGQSVNLHRHAVCYRVEKGNLYRTYEVRATKAKGTKVGFVFESFDDQTLTEEETAFAWLAATYAGAEKVSLWDVQTDVADLYDYAAVWFHSDGNAPGSADLPFRAGQAPLTAIFKDYLNHGGNLLLSGYAVRWVADLELAADRRQPSNIYGGSDPQPLGQDEWVSTSAYPDHPLFAGLTTEQEPTRFVLGRTGDRIKNHTAVWYLKDWGGYENNLGVWREKTGGQALATDVVDGDAVRVTLAEFAPTDERAGRVLCIGTGLYEWRTGASDLTQANTERLTRNAIDYLSK